MTPSAVVALANLKRRRRGDTEPREPLVDVTRARRALAEEGVAVDDLGQKHLQALNRLIDAISELGDFIALDHGSATRAIRVINEVASGSTGTMQLSINAHAFQGELHWHESDPVARLARQIIQAFGEIDPSRLRQCQRQECDLLLLDTTRSRTQRWHAENPCGWLARQHRRRSHD